MFHIRSLSIIILLVSFSFPTFAQEGPDFYDLFEADKLSYNELFSIAEKGEIDYWLMMDMYNDHLINETQFTELLQSRKINYDDLAEMLKEGYIKQEALEKLAKEGVITSDFMLRALEDVGFQPDERSFIKEADSKKTTDTPSRRITLEEPSRSFQAKDKIVTDATDKKTGGVQNFLSEYWVQFWALVVGLIGIFVAVTGFSFANRKKRKSISRYINEIDDTFESFKWKSKRCEAELYRLHDVIDDKLKEGKIDESAYSLLMTRIDKYMKEVQEVHDPVRDPQSTKKKE